MQGSRFDNDELTLAYPKEQVSDAPRVDPDGHLDLEDEEQLYRHYDIDLEQAEARDQSDPQNEHVPSDQRDTDSADWNKTAGLHEDRWGGADREVDPVGGLDSPTVPAASQIPPVRPEGHRRLRRHS
ncbi:hypothetical protein HJ590_17600 [Naumannella sp. ID2617S]|nr:hypothetical protein [Naumannella sp. ID2617S]